MHISYKPLWHTLLERDMRKEDLRLAAGMTTNMIANMSKEGKHISMDMVTQAKAEARPIYDIANKKSLAAEDSKLVETLKADHDDAPDRFCRNPPPP